MRHLHTERSYASAYDKYPDYSERKYITSHKTNVKCNQNDLQKPII